MTTILNGVLGGLVVGLFAAVVTRFVAPSVTVGMLERALGLRASSARWLAFISQLLYGCLAGGSLVALELFVLRIIAIPPTVGEAFGIAVAWSALLFGILLVVWQAGSSSPDDRSRLSQLLVYHIVYGLGFGIWIRLTWIT